MNLLIGMVRTKFVAVLLGTTGIGLRGTYLAITGLVGGLTSLGIGGSGVREVAEANGSGDREQIARTILTLRRMVWLTGGIGTLLTMALAVSLSYYTFKSTEHAVPLMFLAVTIILAALTGGQAALIQGMRRIGDLARMKVIGALAGTVISVVLYYWWGLKAIVPALITLAAINLATAWWFGRKITVPNVSMTWRESFAQAGGLIKLGVAMMWSGLLLTFVTYLTRAFISRQISIEAVGIFHSAFALSVMFIGFVINAMGVDFYPRLTAASSDNQEMNRLVNEQTEIGVLLAAPALIATIVAAPWVIRIFFSAEFLPAVDLMRWFVLGCLGRVVSWPMGFILLAKGESRLFFGTETLANIAHIVLIWVGLRLLGLLGVAVAFVLLYCLYTGLMVVVSGHLTGFRWNKGVWVLFVSLLPISTCVFIGCLLLPVLPATVMGAVVCIGISIYCLRQLAERLGPDHKICRIVRRMPFGERLVPVR